MVRYQYNGKSIHYKVAYQITDKRLHQCKAIKEAVIEYRMDSGGGFLGGGGSGISNPTMANALRSCEPVKQVTITYLRGRREVIHDPEKWLLVAQLVKLSIPKYRQFFDAVFIEQQKAGEILDKCLAASMQELIYLKKCIITHALHLAVEQGLFKIDKVVSSCGKCNN